VKLKRKICATKSIRTIYNRCRLSQEELQQTTGANTIKDKLQLGCVKSIKLRITSLEQADPGIK
jgi:hypothetical protein